jgi:hypothetical protein
VVRKNTPASTALLAIVARSTVGAAPLAHTAEPAVILPMEAAQTLNPLPRLHRRRRHRRLSKKYPLMEHAQAPKDTLAQEAPSVTAARRPAGVGRQTLTAEVDAIVHSGLAATAAHQAQRSRAQPSRRPLLQRLRSLETPFHA